MNYAKVLDGALQLFPKWIKVTLVDATTGTTITRCKMPLEQLPAAFNKPTVMEVEGRAWRILQAAPVLADDFSFSKKLMLRVQPWSGQVADSLYMEPTVAGETPLTVSNRLFDDGNLLLPAGGWRQIEFLPVSMLPVIEEEMAIVNRMLQPEDGSDPLQGYRALYRREKTAAVDLQIPLEDLCKMLEGSKKGSLQLDGGEYVQNGFSMRSLDHSYYGRLQGNEIAQLGLLEFVYMDEELMQVMERYELALVDWCNGSVMTV
jgi:hypothetical protein